MLARCVILKIFVCVWCVLEREGEDSECASVRKRQRQYVCEREMEREGIRRVSL
jgi:hypothetical protein